MTAAFIVEEQAAAGSDALDRITALARLLVQQQAEVARVELELGAAKAALARTETEDLPELMKELGLLDIKLLDGSKVEVKQEVQCGISEARRPEAHKWLTDHKFGGLIKTAILLEYDSDERALAVKAAQKIAKALNRDVEVKEQVHPATLKSFIKEQLALGAEGSKPPADLFGIFPFNKAKVTAPKVAAPRRSKK